MIVTLAVGYILLSYFGVFKNDSSSTDSSNACRNKYSNIDHTLSFNDDDNVLFEDKEIQSNKKNRNKPNTKNTQALEEEMNQNREMEDIKNELIEDDNLQINPDK